MGSGNFDPKAYKTQSETAKISSNSGFAATSMCDEFNPIHVTTRFSKRGPFNEFRDPITVLVGLDVTGSMGKIPKALLTGKLGSMMNDLKQVFDKPNENLQISFAGLGDAKTDRAPLQVTHFESDNRFAQQLQKIWLESGGGANGAENYNLLWWYAAYKTQLNYVKQDNRKGILITIGDDNVHPNLTASEIKAHLDPKYDGGDISNKVLIDSAQEQYEVYHITVSDGEAYYHDHLTKKTKSDVQKQDEAKKWGNLLGSDHVIVVKSDQVADAIADIIKRHRPQSEWREQNKANLTDEQWKEVLSYALCPLSRKFMTKPVEWGVHKKPHEKQAVEDYVREHKRDPITRNTVQGDLVLKPNLNIAQLCENYRSHYEALPADRKERLIELTLGKQKAPAAATEKVTDNNNEKDSMKLFANSAAKSTASTSSKLAVQANQEDNDPALRCALSGETMIDPVMVVATGQTYERSQIEAWFKEHDTDPLTQKKLDDKKIVPNFAMKKLCDDARVRQQSIQPK